jgi:3-phosphoshikimate 1-carboxyvinyltransferase
MTLQYPPEIEIRPVPGPVSGTVHVPGSKSYSNRALVVAGLAVGQSRLSGMLDSEDTRVMIDSLGRLGIAVDADPAGNVTVDGCGGRPPNVRAELFVANSGTSMRFLTALVALGNGIYTLDGIARMRERPIDDLLAALQQLGVDARSIHANGCPPVVVRASGLPGGSVTIPGNVSSQFLSALLMVGPLAEGPLEIVVEGPLVSQPYVDMTLDVVRAFGGDCIRDGYRSFRFTGRSRYSARDYAIEPDASAASYFFGVAAVTGGTITVDGLGAGSLQGDLGFVRVLEQMGCRVAMTERTTTVAGGPLHGVDVDLCDLSDTVPTLAAVASFADTPTRIRNVAHVRKKETDRLAALATELRRVGASVTEHADGLTIVPAPLHAARIQTYNDHRMAMSLALVGLRTAGIVICDPGCTAKTYPDYFTDLSRLCGS